MLAVLVVAAALAQENGQDAWRHLHQGLLELSLAGDEEAAIDEFAHLRRNAPVGEFLREALYWTARARLDQGDGAAAREALTACNGVAGGRSPCSDLLHRIELDQAAIRTIPVQWTFSEARHGFVLNSERGTLRIERNGDNAWLAWTTTDQPTETLAVGFHDPTPAPREARFGVQSLGAVARLRLALYDTDERRYTPATSQDHPIELAPGEPRVVVVRLEGALPDRPDAPPLRAETLDRLEIIDVTAYDLPVRGPNVIRIDDFSVR